MIRREMPGDVRRIHELNCAAFGGPGEAVLVDVLRATAPVLISLIAGANGEAVGHILFTPVVIEGAAHVRSMALAPLAVAPEHQRRGIGSALVHAGLDACRSDGVEAIFVLGDSGYYPRFGFARASDFNIRCAFVVPDDAFMAIELGPRALAGVSGVVRYPDAFKSVTEGGDH